MSSFFQDINLSGAIMALLFLAVLILGIIVIFVWKYRADKQIQALEGIKEQLEKGFESGACDTSLEDDKKEESTEEEYSPLGIFENIELEEPDDESFDIGRSGKKYTEEELEELIRN